VEREEGTPIKGKDLVSQDIVSILPTGSSGTEYNVHRVPGMTAEAKDI
jgi:hypothetical protein